MNKFSEELLAPWHYKRLKEFALKDAVQAFKEGFYCICGDGNITCLTNIPNDPYFVKEGINHYEKISQNYSSRL